jgi:triosephosphate isomerase
VEELTTPVIAANWKMYMTPSETRRYVRSFLEAWNGDGSRTVAFFPPAVSLPAFVAARADRERLVAGLQDVHQSAEGAHTGAVSARMAADAGARWGLAGHSERRHEFGDDPAMVARKVRRLVEAGLRPVLCVGETLEERHAGRLEAVLERQAGPVLRELDSGAAEDLLFAYEPVWAIGTG